MDDGTVVSLKFKNSITGQAKLEKYSEQLSKIESALSGFDSGMMKQVDKGASSIKDAGKESEKASKNFNTLFKIGGVSAFLSSTKKLTNTLSKLSTSSSAYLEDFNLFQVAFNGNTREGERFINTLNEMYGLDESWLMRTTGLFKQLANAMGLSNETGVKLSKLMTQMSIDISSLFNIDVDRASSILQSALAGQTKPARSIGADITQSTLQTTLDKFNLDKQVAQLSYAEKRLLIIISLTDQLSESSGDWGRTLESPANQLRILDEQWQRLSRSVGNLFMPILAKVLPYLNAILMVLTEIISTIATFLGYNVGDFDYFESASQDAWDFNDALESAGSSAKKLKSGLRGFDKLNVISTPTSASSGVGGGAGGINPKLMDAFNKAFDDYQNKLENVQMKATKIRDSIMQWLGFTKEINPITGDVSFKYQGISKTLSNIWEWFKKLSPQGKILTTVIAGLFTSKTIKLASQFFKLIGKTGLWKAITSLLAPVKQLGQYFKVYKSLSGSVIGGIEGATNSWSKQLGVMGRIKTTLVGAGGLIVSIGLVKDSMKSVSEEGWNLKNSLEAGLGVLGSIGSGALIGSQFGALGTVIGGTVGAVWSLYEAFMNYPTSVSLTTEAINKQLENINEYNKSLKEQYDTIKQSEIANMSLQTSYSNLVSELETITDENGKVKKGYEERATFIITTLNKAYGTEIKMTDGVILNYQKQLQSIKDIIIEKRKQIALESSEEAYKVALKEKVNTYSNLVNAENNYAKAIENEKNAKEKVKKAEDDLTLSKITGVGMSAHYLAILNKAKKELENATEATKNSKTALDSATKAYDSNTQAIMTYEGLLSADTKENADLVDKYIKDIENSYYNGKEYIKLTRKEQLDDALRYYSSTLRIAKQDGKKVNNEVIAQAEERLNSLKTNLSDMTNSVDGELGDNLIEAWGTLAQTSEENFITEFSKLNTDIQQNIVNKMYEKGYSISSELQKGIQAENPNVVIKSEVEQPKNKIKVEVDTSEAKRSTSSFWKKLSSAFSLQFGMKIAPLLFANGGLPPAGQLFVANEKGPELIGQIGGQSFVANQNQMMDLLDKKIGNAQSKPINATFVIQVGDKEIARQVINDLQNIAKDNGKPITIGG